MSSLKPGSEPISGDQFLDPAAQLLYRQCLDMVCPFRAIAFRTHRRRVRRKMVMPDLPQIERHWLLLRSLSAQRQGGVVGELSPEFGVSEKTVRRGLQQLRRLRSE